jgi:TrmH family RNA methyltransferase
MKNVIDFDNNVITSRQNPYILYVCKLAEKKHRQKERKFRLDGIKLFAEAVTAGVDIESILMAESAKDKILSGFENFLTIATEQKANVRLVSDGVFEKISEEKSPEGIICIAKYIDKFHKIATIDSIEDFFDSNLKENDKVFALESVRDPGNLGTIIRSSVAFGVDVLLISSDCADIYNPKTIRSTMGSIYRVPFLYTDDLLSDMDKLHEKGIVTYAAHLKGKGFYDEETYQGPTAFLIGNEGNGLSDEISACADTYIRIPMEGQLESLNAAVASAILMYEVHRQRR